MSEATLERRLAEAFAGVRSTVHENPDLFARVTRSIDDGRARRRFRWRLAGGLVAFVIANAVLALSFSNFENNDDNRRLNMPWWVIELITNIVLVALAVGLGPFIKRFGRSYAADVFRANPRTGKSYLVLTDVAYYLIFTSFVLFSVTFVEPTNWDSTGEQLQHEVARVGGMLLIMGVLHALNVVALPIIGGLLSSNRPHSASPVGSAPPPGPGTWILRIEQAPSDSGDTAADDTAAGDTAT